MELSGTSVPKRGNLKSAIQALRRLASLQQDLASADAIDAAVRDNARVGGTNLWVLMLAIVVASVGLNVNSPAVIIGAMLISPLMGPIVAVGYAAAVNDNRLIRSSLAGLALFVLISLASSTLYFALSPLTEVRSEILARTSPTLWDVLIAFFGGTAGMIGLTRKEKTTLIPGVAIATALMPPLCTAGYGLATGQATFFFGAFYLFLINGTFIALAALVVVSILRLPRRAEATASGRRSVVIAALVLAMLAPSVVLAYRLVQHEVFNANAERFVREVGHLGKDVVLLAREIDPEARSVTLTLMGAGITPELEESLRRRMAADRLGDAQLQIRYPSDEPVRVDALKRDIRKELLQGTVGAIEAQSARIESQAARIDRLERAQAALQVRATDAADAEREIRIRLPSLKAVVVSMPGAAANANPDRVWVAIEPTRRLRAAELDGLKRWMATRWPSADVQLLVGART